MEKLSELCLTIMGLFQSEAWFFFCFFFFAK